MNSLSSSGKSYTGLFWRVFLLLTCFDLTIIAFNPLGLAPDEAHYWLWSQRLDWSYYSKGPLLAYLIRLSCSVLGDSEFAVRLPALISSALFSFLLYQLLRKFAEERIAFVVWLLSRSMLIFVQMGLVMTTDAPAALFWLLALYAALGFAKKQSEGLSASGLLLLAAIFCGSGVLVKYTVAILFVSLFAYYLLQIIIPRFSSDFGIKYLDTQSLKAPKVSLLIISGLCFAICLLPIVLWNSRHSFVNLLHNSGHLVKSEGTSLTYKYLLELFAGQLGLAGPISCLLILSAVFFVLREFRTFRTALCREQARVLLVSTLPLLIFVVLISFTKRVYANWPLPLYISGLLLLALKLEQDRGKSERAGLWLARAVLLNTLCVAFSYLALLGFSFGVPGKFLPTKKLLSGPILAEEMSKLRQLEPDLEKPFVLTEDYETASLLGFYLRPQLETQCAVLDERRMNQYDIWANWSDLKGRDALVLLKKNTDEAKLKSYFSALTLVKTFTVSFAGSDLETYRLYTARKYSGADMPRVSRY